MFEMAESHEVLLDVKLDLKDTQNDSCLKNWVNWMKCLVKIDAIECFPCYLKISFYHEEDVHREYPFSIIRLNIPGVRVGSAASRTKSFAYGVFWKNNRKRCRLFLAFEDKQSCSMHMKWLKQSIDSLEHYRKTILENHRISRSIINAVKITDDDESQFDTSKFSLNETQIERDMNDILGPLPDIPVTVDNSSRLSIRRSSGCSGIYEEILENPNNANVKKEQQDSRGSIVSGIYVDMSTPLHLNESAELPPPLPPRRRMQSFNHVYTPINLQNESSSKTRKSTWNLRNVFGRTKETSKILKSIEVVKSQTTASISKLYSDDGPSNLLASSKNSFSTPDLTNIIESCKVAVTPVKCETDENDLDVMDIERSNSLNCSTHQFACRPAPLNISDNILWSHNLSLTLTSTANSSAINLVGANVNSRDSFLGRDLSGYCKMAPILNKSDRSKMVRTSTSNFDDQLSISSQGLDSSSIYCTMAPILPKINAPNVNNESPVSNMMKNITFERTFDFDEDRSSILDCSMKSIEHSNHASLSDITTSSGVSSYDGNGGALNTTCVSPIETIETSTDCRQENDDAISLTYTESPPQSAQSCHINGNPFIYHLSKFDEKTPSYFPNKTNSTNSTNSTVQETTKYTVNNKNTKPATKSHRKPSEPVPIPVHKANKESDALVVQLKTVKKQTCKGVLNTPTSGKVQKFKRRGSIPESNGHFEHHPTAIAYKNENWYRDHNICQPLGNCKYDTLPHSFESKKVLAHLDPNTKYEPNRHASFEKNSKATKIKSSPRRIYNKCALAIRLKTPPSTPTEMSPDERLNSSIDTVMRNKSFHMSSSSDSSGNGLTRSWARFRKIDFSPLKTKINSIWQRPTQEY